MSHKLGISYEEWIKEDSSNEVQDESTTELVDCISTAWENDPSFYLCSYSPDRSRRVLIKLVAESDIPLYEEDKPKIEVYKELFSSSDSSSTTTSPDDDSYTWYYLNDVHHDEDDVSPSETIGALRDFFSKAEEIGGQSIEPNGKEEQDIDTLLLAIECFKSSL